MTAPIKIFWLVLGLFGLLSGCTEPLVQPDSAAVTAADPLGAALQRFAAQLPATTGKPRLLLEPVALGLTGETLARQEAFTTPLHAALRNYTQLPYQPESVEQAELALSLFVIPASTAPDTEVELLGLYYTPKDGHIKAQLRVALPAAQVPLTPLRAAQGALYLDSISLGELWRSVEKNQRIPEYYLRGRRLRAQLYLAQRHFERGEFVQAGEIWETLREHIGLLAKDRVLARQTKLAAILGLYQIALEQRKLAPAGQHLNAAFKLLAEEHQPILARYPFKPDSAEWLDDAQSQTQRQLLIQATQHLFATDKTSRITLIGHVSNPRQTGDASALSQARVRAISELVSAPNKRLKGRMQTAWKGANESLSRSRNPALNAVDNRVELIWLKVK